MFTRGLDLPRDREREVVYDSRDQAYTLRGSESRTLATVGAFRVVSIGFNQPFDTPEALAAFALRQGVDQADWLFVAPRTVDVDALLAEFGLSVERSAGGFDHLVQATIVGADGRIHRQVYGNAFELPMFVGPLKELPDVRLAA